MEQDPRGIFSQQGNFMRVDNALVEDVVCQSDCVGFMVISYAVPGANQTTATQNLRLNINRNTVLLNTAGRNMCLCSIQEGMRVDAVFSPRMTRSIPPQSNAFLIIARRPSQPAPTPNVTTARIAMVDADNGFLLTGNPFDVNSQTRFVVSNTTRITNQNGNPIRLQALRPGQMVRITHADFQTASIPPQTTAFTIQLV